MSELVPFYRDLLEYNQLMNERICDQMILFGEKVSERAAKLMNHILDAHHIWNARINSKAPAYGVWQLHPPAAFMEINRTNYAESLEILSLDFKTKITYTNTKGHEHTNTIGDILFHVINHSTYHRGQVAADLKQNGIDPPIMDYIFHKWQ